jgi:hypothetical protein
MESQHVIYIPTLFLPDLYTLDGDDADADADADADERFPKVARGHLADVRSSSTTLTR